MARSREEIEAVKKGAIAEAMVMRRMNKEIPVSGRRGILPLDGRDIDIVYYEAKEKNAPILIGFHGGGFLFGGCAMNDGMWSAVRDRLGVNVASIEYRKSPEYQYMDAINDAYDAAVYLKEHRSEYGHGEKMLTMGCSAGANLSAAVCIAAKQRNNPLFDAQILLYPFLDTDTDPDSKGAGSLEGPIMYVFNELHCRADETRNPLVSPIFASKEELTGLPKAVIVLAENDNLRNEGERYGEMLSDAGVKVSTRLCERMPHGFFESGFGEISEGEMNFLGDDVIRMIKSGEIHETSVKAMDFIAENL